MIRVENMQAGYLDVVKHVLRWGDPVAPRGQNTREVLDAVIRVYDVTRCLPVDMGRGVRPAIGAVEAAQLIGGVSDPELTVRVAPNMRQFQDSGEFWGAYGPRTAGQLELVEQVLRQDRDTRQAVLSIWRPDDLGQVKHDMPCTVFLQFLIRKNKLVLHTSMRSNDVWWGLAYDAFQFTQLQLTMADALGIEPGVYHHHAVSLHIYERDWNEAEDLRPPSQPMRPLRGFETHGDIATGMHRARRIVANDMPRDLMTDTERWYAEALEQYRG